MAISTVEAEYLSATEATKQALHHRILLKELGVLNEAEPTIIRCDNQGCIALTENPVHHERTKHFDIRHHFIREKVQDGDIRLHYRSTKDIIAEVMTKALSNASSRSSEKKLASISYRTRLTYVSLVRSVECMNRSLAPSQIFHNSFLL